MAETVDMESATLTQRVVLLGVADAADGESPVHAGEVVRTCNDALGDVEGDVVGRLTESEVAPALQELEADGLVEGYRGDTSPVGKGRPKYRLAVDRDDLLDELAADERVSGLVDEIR